MKHLLLWSSVALFLSVFSSVRGAVVYDNFVSTYGPAGYILVGPRSLYSINTGTDAQGNWVTDVRTEQNFVYPGNPVENTSTAIQRFTVPRELDLFPKGTFYPMTTVESYQLWQTILERVKNSPYKPAPDFQKNYVPRNPAGGGNSPAIGVRGSLDGDSGTLFEASPAWATFVTDPNNPFQLVPFIVENQGDGDYLSIYDNSGLVWNQPLSAFITGSVYFAVIPPLADESSPYMNVTTMFLRSTGQANARVSFYTNWNYVSNGVSVPDAGCTSILIAGAFVSLFLYRSCLARSRAGVR